MGALKASHLWWHESTSGIIVPRCYRQSVVFFHLKESIPNLQPHLMLRPFQYLTQHFRSVEDIQNQQSTRTQKSLFNPILTWDISGQAYTKPSTWPFHLDGSHNIISRHHQSSPSTMSNPQLHHAQPTPGQTWAISVATTPWCSGSGFPYHCCRDLLARQYVVINNSC